MQNKPNLREAQINVTSVLIKNYEENWPPTPRKNKPKQTQFQTQFFLPTGSPKADLTCRIKSMIASCFGGNLTHTV
jgi:hypothetical protein